MSLCTGTLRIIIKAHSKSYLLVRIKKIQRKKIRDKRLRKDGEEKILLRLQ